ncbi:hypothetical protein PPERSA_06487 [Pseudocohnilembus persalinus]|uniref:USP domain-containing protein n=1 Tax=Pseudocohnilembus persalinus TaxID=266149 RepID=A0A0V0QSH0_PSEPJ|nr:hypothetical protein PPERSA_06487 [Pseudocohnilembus persalinus]|eukprot:KRX04853.1 hypothetical protein PPERSA_06487 [Pseudocohnilembus persalinus]
MNKDQNIRYSGLTNHGATCYMNSLLQTLFMTPEFRNRLFEWKFDEKVQHEEDSTPLQLQILFSQMAEKKYKYCNTKALIKPVMEEFQQQDIQEFTRVLFHTIEVSCDSTWLNEIYQGAVENYIHCKNCKQDSTRIEFFQDITITVRSIFDNVHNNSLEKALKFYLKPEHLEGSNAYFCEKCNEKQEAVKGTRFKQLPDILTFTLSRFELDFETFMRKKINHFVHYPYILNMNKFMKDYDSIDAYDPPLVDPEEEKKIQEKVQKSTPALANEINSQIQNQKILPKRKASFDQNTQQSQENQLFEDIKVVNNHFADDSTLVKSKDKDSSNFLTETEQKQKIKEDINNLQKSKQEFDKILGSKNKKSEKQPEQKQEKEDNKKEKEKQVKFNLNPALISNMDEIFNVDEMFNTNTDEIWDPLDPRFSLQQGQNKEAQGEKNSALPKITEEEQKELDEKLAEEKKQELQKQFEDLVNKKNENQSQIQQSIEEYLKEGEHVYELYAVNVHAGGAMGGHYYSYVKSFENQMWQCFNDTNVSSTDPSCIQAVYGEQNPKFNSGSSAYVLHYRKVGKNKNLETLVEPPSYIKEMLEKEEKRMEEQRIKEEKLKAEKQQMITIKVIYKNQTKPIDIKKTETLQNLLTLIKIEHNILIPDEDWRLRLFNQHEQVMRDTYEGKEDQQLQDLKIESYRTYIVETKQSGQKFEEYDAKAIQINLAIWRQNITSLDDQGLDSKMISKRPDTTTLQQLLETITDIFDIQQEKIVLVKRKINNDKYSEIININEECLQKTLDKFDFYNQIQLYIEEKDENNQIQELWEKEFEMDKTRCIIQYNYPIPENVKSHPPMDLRLVIDNRRTIRELKQQIAKNLNLDMNNFIIKKNGISSEFTKMDSKICENAIRNRGSIICKFGTPSNPGEFKFQFILGQLSKEKTDKISYDFEDLSSKIGEFNIHQDINILELKKILSQKLKEKNVIDIIPEKLRLSERVGDRLTTHIFKYIEEREQQQEGEILLYAKLWDVMNFELSEAKELFIDKNATLHQFAEIVSILFDQKIEQLQGVSQQSISIVQFDRTKLLDIEEWTDLYMSQNELQGGPWFCQDGMLIIVRNNQQNADVEQLKQKYGTQMDGVVPTYQGPVNAKPNKKYIPEKAMTITIKKKQNQENENQENQDTENTNQEQNKTQSENQNFQSNQNDSDNDQEYLKEYLENQNQIENKFGDTSRLFALQIALENQRELCEQIPEIISIIEEENPKEVQIVWYIQMQIINEKSLYYQHNINLTIIFTESILKGGMPMILVKEPLFHPNIEYNKENSNYFGFQGLNRFDYLSLRDEFDAYLNELFAQVTICRLINQLDSPNISNGIFILNKEAGELYQKEDKTDLKQISTQKLVEIVQHYQQFSSSAEHCFNIQEQKKFFLLLNFLQKVSKII